ncbi:MAG: FtsW/RodA/SpoVE family cell cycle protein [Lachnospiraceae bacterium]
MLFDYNFRNFNFRLVIYVLLLNIFGVLIIRSATNQDMAVVGKQIMGIMVGFGIVLALSLLDYHKVLSAATLIYAISIALLIAVLLFGKTINNATRWLVLPAIGQIQPSEFVKIGLIVFFAWFFSRHEEQLNQFKTLTLAAVLFGIPFYLIYKEPDLSTSIVSVVVFVGMLFVAGLSYRWIAGVLAVLIPCGALFIYLLQYSHVPILKPYQANRILAFVFPSRYAEANLQQNNSIMAIGSGMLGGKGLNNNTLASVKNGNFLSEEQTDFIFAVIGEELGFIGCSVVIILIALVVFECLLMASRARDTGGKLICTGMAALVAFQSFANIAVATGLFPNTGLPLPFISSGVSSLVSIYFGIGIALNVGLQRKSSNH